MILLVIRHGESEADILDVHEGRADFELTEKRALAGLSREEADRLYPRVENLPIDQAVYGQESKVEFRSRAENVLHRVLSENGPESVIAIVTHGGMVNQLYGALLHLPIGENCIFRTSDTGIHIWEITEHGSYVIKANVDDHISGICATIKG